MPLRINRAPFLRQLGSIFLGEQINLEHAHYHSSPRAVADETREILIVFLPIQITSLLQLSHPNGLLYLRALTV